MDTTAMNENPISLKAEHSIIEIILFMTSQAIKRGDEAALADLEEYITKSYLTLGYTNTDYVVTLREYVEALRLSVEGQNVQEQVVRTQNRIIRDMRELVEENAEELDSLFYVDESGEVMGLSGRISTTI